MPTTPETQAPAEGQILSVEPTGWAGDITYIVQQDGQPIQVDAYVLGSALLQPGQVVTLPAPATTE